MSAAGQPLEVGVRRGESVGGWWREVVVGHSGAIPGGGALVASFCGVPGNLIGLPVLCAVLELDMAIGMLWTTGPQF